MRNQSTVSDRSRPERARIKRHLARFARRRRPAGVTMLIYHRIGADTLDERDVSHTAFEQQMRLLRDHRVAHLDDALDSVGADDGHPTVVLTFDDGFADVATRALPILVDHQLPFTLYLSTAYVGGQMHWDGSTASAPGPALTWNQLDTLMASGLCTIGNHTHSHVRPELLNEHELDRCTKEIEARLGVTPRHFAYPWGVPVPRMERALRQRFRSAATGQIGRNHPGVDPMRLRRVPVRGSDPRPFFEAKLSSSLGPECAYDALVRGAKALGFRA